MKKTALSDYDTNRAAGVIAINLRDGDELVSAQLASAEDDLLLISRQGQSLRFTATDEALRPMGRATSGVTGMKFRDGDELLSANVVTDDSFVFVVTAGGYAKRTQVDQYRVQGRGGLGIKVAKLAEDRGELVGGLIVGEEDEVMVVMQSGKVVRTSVQKYRPRAETPWASFSLSPARTTRSSKLPATTSATSMRQTTPTKTAPKAPKSRQMKYL